MTWLLDLVRGLLSILDRMVYGLIEVFYTTFMKISNVRVLDGDTVLKEFSERIYVFLAIIMLFKVTFSIISYIINPDNFSNNEKGVGKLIQNSVIVLVLIVITPQIFEQAYNLQKIILKENIIGKVILGYAPSPKDDDKDNELFHKTISFDLLSSFLKLNTDDIPNLSYNDDNGLPTCKVNNEEYAMDISSKVINSENLNTFHGCLNSMSDMQTFVKDDEEKRVSVGVGSAYTFAYRKKNYQNLISLITAKSNTNRNIYIFDYTYLISTLAGGFVAWIFLVFCFDIAVRSVKLSFMQLIAPIPIISYIDPKSGKNGMFQKWVKTSLSVYADLFIRIAAIYFAIYIIKMISMDGQIYYMTDLVDGTPGPIIKVFIIIGALMFAKQIPKLIEDIAGIKLSGKFELNPLKKMGESPFAAAALGGIGAGIGGFGANLANSIISNKGQGVKGFFKGMGSTIAGTASGFVRGNVAGLQGKGKDNAWNAVTAGLKGTVDARNLRARRVANGDGGPGGFFRRRGVDLQNAAGIESGATKFDNEIAAYDEIQSQADELLKIAEKEMVKANGLSFVDAGGNSITMSDYKAKQEELKLLQGMDTSEWKDSSGNIDEARIKQHAQRISNLSDYITKTGKEAAKAWIDSAQSGAITDSAALTAKNKLQTLQDKIARSAYSKINSQKARTGNEVKALKDEMERIKSEVIGSDAYRQAQVNKKNDSNK